MKFSDEALNKLILNHRMSCDEFGRAECDNYLFEQRISDKRVEHFEANLGAIDDYVDLQSGHNAYYDNFVCVGEGFTPVTFEPSLAPAYLGLVDSSQKLVRIESLSRPLSKLGMSFEKLKAARDNGVDYVVEVFLDSWNKSRDLRPAFATFRDHIVDDMQQPEWPEILRNRLGLAHYNCWEGGTIPIALVEYEVQEVLGTENSVSASTALAVPTVFDSGPWPHFFPSPGKLNFGRTMSLNEIVDDENLLVELLHPRIDYKPRHIVELAELRIPPPNIGLKILRNSHLLAVQVAANDSSFGEEIP